MSRFMKPHLSIIIPVWNALAETQLTLRTLAAENDLKDPKTEIIIVDNGSDDITRDWLRSVNWLPLKIVRNPHNFGFPTACNQGSDIARGEVLCFLNSDVISEGPWTRTLYKATLPKNVGQAGPDLVWCPGGGFNFPESEKNWSGRRTPYINGWCLAMRRDVFQWINGFDEQYSPGYSEDRDLGYRVYNAGLELRSVSLPLRHLVGVSAGTNNFDRSKALKHGEMLFDKKWGGDNPSKKIAVLRGWAMGDMIMTGSALGGMRRKWPNSHISLVTTQTMIPWVRGLPYIDDILLIDDVRTSNRLNGESWDMVVQLQDLRPNDQMPAHEARDNKFPDGELNEFKVANSKDKRLWWKEIDKRPMGRFGLDLCRPGWHTVQTYCHVIGNGVRPWYSYCGVTDEAAVWADEFLMRHSDLPTILVHPSGGWRSKRWPPEAAVRLLGRLAFRRIAHVICVGIYEKYPLPEGVIDLRAKTTPERLAALLERVDCVVSGDNGITHAANALNTPVVEIWGPTMRHLYTPVGRGPLWHVQTPVPCRNCSRPHCRMLGQGGKRMPCVSDLDDELVVDTVREALAHGPNKPRDWHVGLEMLEVGWEG